MTDTHEIRLDDVCVDVAGGIRILDGVTLCVAQRRIAVIGANGSGKSTFARLLNGIVEPTAGTVRVHGLDSRRDRRAVLDRVGFIFSNPDAQILMPTVAEDVALSLRGAGLSKRDVADRVHTALDAYGLAARADQPAYSLSGGEKQLLALASVLVRSPQLVVADEPTTLLDLGHARRMGNLLIEHIDAQVVIVTHDLELASRCDVAVRFAHGRLTEVGSPAEVIAAYRDEFARNPR